MPNNTENVTKSDRRCTVKNSGEFLTENLSSSRKVLLFHYYFYEINYFIHCQNLSNFLRCFGFTKTCTGMQMICKIVIKRWNFLLK